MGNLGLLDNAIDYLQHGLHHLQEYEERLSISDIKQSIINLINSLDLFVLEKLRQVEGEEAIFASNNNKKEDYDTGYRATVHVGNAYRRIKAVLQNTITDDEQSAYDILKLLRDSAVHYEFAFGQEKEENMLFLLHYIGRFIDLELSVELENVLANYHEFYFSYIEGTDYYVIVQERAEEARKEMIRNDIYWYEYDTVKNGAPQIVLDWVCDECSEQSVAADNRLGVDPGVCAICFAEHEIKECFKCGQRISINHEGKWMFEGYWCDFCADHYERQ
ncbi:hypothetical protein IEN91_14790 [Bacillus velezensis]|uniref:hypothetical protein n=1 Tax=Bacillus velezensis TaxID=492670 RepID=UPI0018C50348|nr:hypothetical protein [Bacillus velezensis]QPK87881.1 hypothetical protein IEN91_14790 [Bacillus velezensis]